MGERRWPSSILRYDFELNSTQRSIHPPDVLLGVFWYKNRRTLGGAR